MTLTAKVISFSLSFILCGFAAIGCGSDKDDDNESDPEVPSMSIRCGHVDNDDCTTALDGKVVRGALFSGDCSSFSSDTTVLSVGTGTVACDATDCVTAENGLVSNWSKASLPAGDYQVYVFIDADNNSVPNGEPYACNTLTLPSNESPNYENFQ